jgi:hypothetical protein
MKTLIREMTGIGSFFGQSFCLKKSEVGEGLGVDVGQGRVMRQAKELATANPLRPW